MTPLIWLLLGASCLVIDVGLLIKATFTALLWSFAFFGGLFAVAYLGIPVLTGWVHAVGWVKILFEYVPIYLILGVVVAFLKWMQYVHKQTDPMEKLKEGFEKIYHKNWYKMYQDHWFKGKPTTVPPNVKPIGSGFSTVSTPPPAVESETDAPEHPAVDERAFRRALFLQNRTSYRFQDMSPNRFALIDMSPKQIAKYSSDRVFLDEVTPKAKAHKMEITAWIFQWPFVIVATAIGDWLVNIGHYVAKFFDAKFGEIARRIMGRATQGL
jgi:hypothetical protein